MSSKKFIKMKYIILFIFLNLVSMAATAFTVLIDPGHGGDDTGAKSKMTGSEKQILEKDLALSISKKVYDKLKPFHSVYLTRSIDRNVTLKERSELAEKIKADIFVSIHLNSAPSKDSNGVEIYYLDNHNDVAVKKVENLENIIVAGEEQQINHILTDLIIQQTVDQSKLLASSLDTSIKKGVVIKHKMKNRGVRPGLFYVLALAKRPGVLIEVGFISNQEELKKLQTESFQTDMSNAIVEGILKFSRAQKKPKVSLF